MSKFDVLVAFEVELDCSVGPDSVQFARAPDALRGDCVLRPSLKRRTHLLYPWVPLGFGMRAKFIFATLVGLLFCSLATLEINELFELTDDTSNDFSFVGTQQASSGVVAQSLELQPKTNRTTETKWPTARLLCPSASSHAKDVLHLLCIMRT